MVMEVKLWVALTALGITVPVLAFAVKWAVNRIVSKLDEININLTDFQIGFAKVWGEITNVKDKVEVHDKRINSHAARIKDIELKQAKNEFKQKLYARRNGTQPNGNKP